MMMQPLQHLKYVKKNSPENDDGQQKWTFSNTLCLLLRFRFQFLLYAYECFDVSVGRLFSSRTAARNERMKTAGALNILHYYSSSFSI